MHQFRWAVATAAAAILASAFSTQPAVVAETNKKAKRCVVAAARKPDCGANAKAVCVAAKVACPYYRPCAKWTCVRGLKPPQTREPFKGPKPLPWSRRLPPSPITR
jgi:hypothetical protein